LSLWHPPLGMKVLLQLKLQLKLALLTSLICISVFEHCMPCPEVMPTSTVEVQACLTILVLKKLPSIWRWHCSAQMWKKLKKSMKNV
jgi:hypothetical protein